MKIRKFYQRKMYIWLFQIQEDEYSVEDDMEYMYNDEDED